MRAELLEDIRITIGVELLLSRGADVNLAKNPDIAGLCDCRFRWSDAVRILYVPVLILSIARAISSPQAIVRRKSRLETRRTANAARRRAPVCFEDVRLAGGWVRYFLPASQKSARSACPLPPRARGARQSGAEVLFVRLFETPDGRRL